MPTHATLPVIAARWHAESRRGPRRVNADATAARRDPATGLVAYAVADGVGDTERAAAAARLAAEVAAGAAGRLGPAEALVAAQRALLAAAPDEDGGDCVLVVAVPRGTSCAVAWVGDCRAYLSNGRVLQQITVDHTVAEHYRARRLPVTPRMEHLVTTSVRTLRPELIGTSTTGFAAGRLLLCSDGVHRALTASGLRTLLDGPVGPDRAAGSLVDTALRFGGRDNATALVLDTAPPPVPELAAAA